MSIGLDTIFSRVIQEHLELKSQNADLEPAMPIHRYGVKDPFANHPLFKSEEQARREETRDGVHVGAALSTALAWPGEDSAEGPALVAGLWGRPRDFDWGE
jgi:hypothetical protein